MPVQGGRVPQDFAEAAQWYRRAADHGHAAAQLSLAFLYARGLGVPHDEAEAAKWCRTAALSGYAPAQARLGFRFANGLGVPKDDSEAYFWLTLAFKQGDKNIEKLRSAEAAKLSNIEITKRDHAADEWLAKR
jgi:TPR repeat protein